jgi:hypothetical protein
MLVVELKKPELDLILDYNDQVHRVHLPHRLRQPLYFKQKIRTIFKNNQTNFEELQLNEVIVYPRLLHPIFLNDVKHFLVVIDKIYHPNLI